MTIQLIAYHAKDGIENALYPGRWIVLSETPGQFAAAHDAAESMIGFLFDQIDTEIAYCKKMGDCVVPYEPPKKGGIT